MAATSIDKMSTAPASKTRNFRLDQLEIDPDWNERDKESPDYIEHIEFLVNNIAELGVRTALKGYLNEQTGKIRIYDGHCRYTAVLRLKEERGLEVSLPVEIGPKNASEADRILSMLVDNTGLAFTDVEKSRVVRRLHNYGWSLAQIGKLTKPTMTVQQVQTLMDISQATESTKKLISRGYVKPTTVASAVRADGADAAETVVSTAVEISQKGLGKETATAPLVQDVREGILSGEIEPADILDQSLPEETRNQNIQQAVEKIKQKKKRLSADNILNGEVDPEALTAKVFGQEKKKEKPGKETNRLAMKALILKERLQEIVNNRIYSVEAKGNDRLLIEVKSSDWQEIISLLSSGEESNSNNTTNLELVDSVTPENT